MPYQDLIHAAVRAVVETLEAINVAAPSGAVYTFQSVAVSEARQLDVARLPAAFVIMGDDQVGKKTKNLEEHTLKLTISAVQQVATNSYGDTEFIDEFSTGPMYAALAYDALVKDRTLGGLVRDLKIIRVGYGRTLLDTQQLLFWGDLEVELILRYLPSAPLPGDMIEHVFSKGGIT